MIAAGDGLADDEHVARRQRHGRDGGGAQVAQARRAAWVRAIGRSAALARIPAALGFVRLL
ncbi:MAG: hypothetical protein K0S35_2758, partial [Geminicoccaceae bacterium]|nr:hypothetical protein [Geminicoccaceae bacterium]